MSETQQEMAAVMPQSVNSSSNSQKGTGRNKMDSSGNAELFKTQEIAIVDNKLSSGNENLFKSNFAKSEKESDAKSLQHRSQRAPHESKKSGLSSKQTSKQSPSKRRSVDNNSPEVSGERSINQSHLQTVSNMRNSRISQQRSEKRNPAPAMTPGERAEKVAQLSPMRGAKIPGSRFNYALDAEERDIIQKGQNLSKQEIWALLEKKRFGELKRASVNLQGQLLTRQRCPKCTLVPPCQHYKSTKHLANEAQRYVYSESFREVMKGAQRENLLSILKQQSYAQSHQMDQTMPGDSQFYLQTLDNSEGGPHTVSVNRFDGSMPVPIQMPEQDPAYESEQNFKSKRASTKPKLRPNQRLEPLKVKQTGFLRRGNGNGGSPTSLAVTKKANDSGMITLSPIQRKAAETKIRVRDKAGGYQYVSAASLHASNSNSPRRNGEMSPSQRRALEKKNKTQQKIAEFRMLKYQREQERQQKEDEEAEEQRRKLADAQARRANYMNAQKQKLQEYQVARALQLGQQALKEEEEMRVRAEREAQRKAQEQYKRKMELAQWRAEKRKAEQMLLMANTAHQEDPMREQMEDEEYSIENEPQQQDQQVFEQDQNREFALKEDKSSHRASKRAREESKYSADGYSGFEDGTSSVPKSKTDDKKSLTQGNFKKTERSEDDGYSSVRNTVDGRSAPPKSSKSPQKSSSIKKSSRRDQPSESNNYTNHNFDEDYSQGTSEIKPASVVKSAHNQGEMLTGAENLANPPSMAQLQQDSGTKTEVTNKQSLHQKSIEEADRILIVNDSAQKNKQQFEYAKLDPAPGSSSNGIDEEIDPSYSQFDGDSKEKNNNGGTSEHRSNEEFFLDEENISVSK